LSEAEVAQIASLTATAGKSPRLIRGFHTMIRGVETIDVFLEPETVDGGVQRGRILRLVADDPPAVPERSAWRLKETRLYACIAVPGRRPLEISGERDLGWPFVVDGQIDDATLLDLVAFIRSKPRIPGIPDGVSPRNIADAPVSSVVRRGDEVLVGLGTGQSSGSRVTLVRKEGLWVITHYEDWIA
jgi:hypothetical protein